MYHEAASQLMRVMHKPADEGIGEANSRPMKPAKTPKGGNPIAASARSENKTAYRGITEAKPLTDRGSTSSPYLVRMTCHATKSPLVARPTAPPNIAARGVIVRVEAANHQSIEKNERLPYANNKRTLDCANALMAP
jgi:hypothetical protein